MASSAKLLGQRFGHVRYKSRTHRFGLRHSVLTPLFGPHVMATRCRAHSYHRRLASNGLISIARLQQKPDTRWDRSILCRCVMSSLLKPTKKHARLPKVLLIICSAYLSHTLFRKTLMHYRMITLTTKSSSVPSLVRR